MARKTRRQPAPYPYPDTQIVYIFRPWITIHGRRIYARDLGLTAFKIPKRY